MPRKRSEKKTDLMAGLPKQGFVVAIDGPAGTGKSSVTRRLSDVLNFTFVDTGALYRAVAYLLLKSKSGEMTSERATRVAKTINLEFKRNPKKNPANRIFANGQDVSDFIRTPEVSMAASKISAFPGVRAALLGMQRRMGCKGKTILEGRDIGTVIFPDADIKFFLTATADERAKRRLAELEAMGIDAPSFEEVKNQIITRDEADQGRKIAPLRQAEDAVAVDTSHLTLDEVVSLMVAVVKTRYESQKKKVRKTK